MRKTVAAAAMAGSLNAGGALGIALFGPTSAIGQTTTTTPATPTTPGNGGTFRSNEDPTHEGTEAPGREADENAGRGFGRGGRCHHMGGASNEGAAHEGTESTGREGDEGSGQTPSTPSSPTPPAPASGSPSV